MERRRRWRAEETLTDQGRGSRESIALQLELTHLTLQPDKLLALGRRRRRLDRPGLPAAFLPVGLGDPDRIARRRAQTRGSSPPDHVRPDQVDHLSPEFRRVGESLF
jgi:hypothetical protein